VLPADPASEGQAAPDRPDAARDTTEPAEDTQHQDVGDGAAPPAEGTADAEVRQFRRPAPTILVLGPVEIVDAGGPVEPTKRNRLTELAAYLALNPGTDHVAIDAAVWPATRVSVNARNTAMSKLRRWLGKDSDGNDYLPRYQSDTGYRLRDEVTTDWHLWCDLLPEGAQQATTDDLEQVLALVRSRPFDGVRAHRYAWAENLRQTMISAIVDVAYELARRRLIEGRWRAAEQAVVVGLTVEPGMERLWRIRIMAAHASGNPAAEQEATDRLLAIVDELGGDLEEETEQLLQELRDGSASRAL
jgi:DNA-binding SARP family transcriptional activator